MPENPIPPTRDAADTRMTEARAALFAEIEQTLQSASEHSRARIFDGTARLFLKHADALDSDAVALFDELFLRQIDGVDTDALAALSAPLAPVLRPPVKLLRQLAHHPCAAVAVPILIKTTGLDSSEVLAIAKSCGPEHLLAICQRADIDTNLAALLIARGDQNVIDTLAKNPGAKYLTADFGDMLGRATADERARVQTKISVDIRNAEFGPAMTRCTMNDISPGGAKLQCAGSMPLPETFIIEFPNVEKQRVQCRKIWQRDSIAGVLFTSSLVALWGATAVPLTTAPTAQPHANRS